MFCEFCGEPSNECRCRTIPGKKCAVGVATPDEIAAMGVDTFLRENADRVIVFAFPRGGQVFIKGSNLRGVVLGQMSDCNGHKYEVEYECQGKTQRNWFDQTHLVGA